MAQLEAFGGQKDWMQQHARIQAAYSKESDRAVALLAAAFLDTQLGEALREVFVDSPVVNALLEDRGPLTTLAARIDALFCMGFMSEEFRRDMHLVRKIRNDFAHHPDVIDFNTDAIKDRCNALLPVLRKVPNFPVGSAREAYLIATSLCVFTVRHAAGSAKRPTVVPNIQVGPQVAS